jgi:predicted nuclease of predicted toxin-antitoxin system
MKLLVDANLSPTVARALRVAGYDATHVGEVSLLTASDIEISAFAVSSGAVIVSADSDFATLLALSGASAPSLVLLRSSDHLPPPMQASVLLANLSGVVADLKLGAVVTIARGHVRVRTLPIP